MQNNIKQTSRSSWRGTSGPLSTLTEEPACPSGRLYGFQELTLDRFIRCLCDDDLSYLVMEGDFPRETLQSAWAVIYEQFLDGMKDKEGIRRLRLMGKINHLNFIYELVHLCVRFLEQAYDREILDILRRHIALVGAFNPEDMEGYFKDLQNLLTRAQSIKAQILDKTAEYAALGGKPGQKVTAEQFGRLIASVSIFAKFHIDKKSVTIAEFINYYMNMRETSDAIEEQKNKR